MSNVIAMPNNKRKPLSPLERISQAILASNNAVVEALKELRDEPPARKPSTAPPSAEVPTTAGRRRRVKVAELDGELDIRRAPKRVYSGTAELHSQILALLDHKGVIFTEDLERDLGLSRMNADYHLRSLAEIGALRLGYDHTSGHYRSIASRDYAKIAKHVPPVTPDYERPPYVVDFEREARARADRKTGGKR